MRHLNVVNGILQSVNNLLGNNGSDGKVNTGSVQDVLLNNIRRIGVAIGGTRGNNGRIGSGLVFDPDSLTISPGVGFTKSGNIIQISKQILLDDTGEFSIGDKVWLNIAEGKVELEEVDGGLEVETTSSDYTGSGVLVVFDDSVNASRTAGGYESILIGAVVAEGEGTPCSTFGDGMAWKSAPRGIAATEGDILKVEKLYATEVIADIISVEGEIDLKNIVADTVVVKNSLTSKGDTTLEDATISKDLTVIKDAEVGGELSVEGDITSNGNLTTEGAVTTSKELTSSKKLTVKEEGFDVTGNSIVRGDLEVTGTLKAGEILGLPEQVSDVPIGTMILHAAKLVDISGNGPLKDYLICDGTDYNSTLEIDGELKWKPLFDVISTAWGDGTGDGSGGSGTTGSDFNVPNMANLVPIGSEYPIQVGTTTGSSTHTLSLREMPNHTHNGDFGGSSKVDTKAVGMDWTASGTSSEVASGVNDHTYPIADGPTDRDAASAFSVVQPSAHVHYYIKFR